MKIFSMKIIIKIKLLNNIHVKLNILKIKPKYKSKKKKFPVINKLKPSKFNVKKKSKKLKSNPKILSMNFSTQQKKK
jgi:hypothetical protein